MPNIPNMRPSVDETSSTAPLLQNQFPVDEQHTTTGDDAGVSADIQQDEATTATQNRQTRPISAAALSANLPVEDTPTPRQLSNILGSRKQQPFKDVSDNYDDYHSDSMLTLGQRHGLSSVKPAGNFSKVMNKASRSKKPPRHVKGKQWRKTMRTGVSRGGGRAGAREADAYQEGRVAAYGGFQGIDLEIMTRASSALGVGQWSPGEGGHSPGTAEQAYKFSSFGWSFDMFFNVCCMQRRRTDRLRRLDSAGSISDTPQTPPPSSKMNGLNNEAAQQNGDVKPKGRRASSDDVGVLDVVTEVEDEDEGEGVSEKFHDAHREADDENESLDGDHGRGSDAAQHGIPDEEMSYAFVFDFGCVVLWNFPSVRSERLFLSSLTPFSHGARLPGASEEAEDDMGYFRGNKSSVRNDLVELATGDLGEKTAVSFALAQSCLLSVYEFRISKTIDRNEHIPRDLAMTGQIHMTQDQISREVGRLFMERNSINLESDILDTPDFLWENDMWAHVYEKVCEYLEQSKRIEIMNRRLDCVGELLDVLNTQIENQHASKLEWIIIWLIVAEVAISVVWQIIIKDILGYFNHECGGCGN